MLLLSSPLPTRYLVHSSPIPLGGPRIVKHISSLGALPCVYSSRDHLLSAIISNADVFLCLPNLSPPTPFSFFIFIQSLYHCVTFDLLSYLFSICLPLFTKALEGQGICVFCSSICSGWHRENIINTL